VKGDSFAEKRGGAGPGGESRGAARQRLRNLLYGSTWARPPEVASSPRSSKSGTRVSGTPAAYENAKWIYTAWPRAHPGRSDLD